MVILYVSLVTITIGAAHKMTNLWQGVNGINNPCPSGYRIPTEAELEAERLSWSQIHRLGLLPHPLKLPMAGSRIDSSGSLSHVGDKGYYWSSTVTCASSRYLTSMAAMPS